MLFLKHLIVIGIGLLLVISGVAHVSASTTPVLQVDLVNDLTTCCSIATILSVSVRGSLAINDGGGGQFVAQDPSLCTASDGGVVIKEGTGTLQRCWFRQFSGPVHLKWYGVADAATPGCYGSFTSCDATTAVNLALAAAAVNKGWGGDGGVTTDGRSIAITSHCGSCIDTSSGITILEGQYLTCAGPPGARRDWGSSTDSYWTAPDSIVLSPSYTIVRNKNTRLSDCFIRPTWLNPSETPQPTAVEQTVLMVRKFMGLATKCTDDGCNMSNMLIAGFDTCDSVYDGSKAVLSNIVEDCLLNEWVHKSGGSSPKLSGITPDPILEGSLTMAGAQKASWTIVSVMQDSGAANRVVVRIDPTTSTFTSLNPSGGDTVFVTGLSAQANIGAPVSANGRWLTSQVTPVTGLSGYYDVLLSGASWSGPTYSGSSWLVGSRVISVSDTTNIKVGQYICASGGTAPFCPPPAGFSFLSTTLSGGGLTAGANTASVGSTLNWPPSGLVQIGSTSVTPLEYAFYTVKDTSTITLTQRGVRGTSGAAHANGDPVTAAAPVVLGVVPPVINSPSAAWHAVIVSAPASSSATNPVFFANDLVSWGTTTATLTINPSYHTWTYSQNAGGQPSSTFNVRANSAGSGASSLTSVNNCFKAQPGMVITDLTNSLNLPPLYVKSCSSGMLVFTTTIPSGYPSFIGDLIHISGCGYPGLQPYDTGAVRPWLGNCAATGLLLGDALSTDATQGVICDSFHGTGSEIEIHSINAPATNCANFVMADSGDDGAQDDPDAVALWLDGQAGSSQYSNGRLGGSYNSFLDTPSTEQNDGVGISNVHVASNIALGALGNVTLSSMHGHPNSPNPAPYLFSSASATGTQILGANLSAWSVASDDPAAFPKLYCTGNDFATALCSQVKGTPVCLSTSGCTSISGTDSAFTIVPNASAVTVTLIGQYLSPPICTMSPSASGGTPVSSATSVAYAPYGTTVTFNTIGTVASIYGSCRAAG